MSITVQSSALYENVGKDTEEWLHGAISRDEVKSLLSENGMQDGLFLVRESTRNKGDYVLSMAFQGKVQHYVIRTKEGNFRVDDGPPFQSLGELVRYYKATDDRLPTPLRTPVAKALVVRKGENYEQVWEANHTAQAAIKTNATLTMGSQSMVSKSMSLPRGGGAAAAGAHGVSATLPPGSRMVAVEPGSAYASSNSTQGAAAQGVEVNKRGVVIPTAREGFKNLEKVKKWTDRQESVDKLDVQANIREVEVPEDLRAGGRTAETAKAQEERFALAAQKEEKMYLAWLNKHLQTIGKEAKDISGALKNGVLIMDVMKLISKLQPPSYHKKTMVMQQEVDNWHVVVKFAKKLGIIPSVEGPANDPEFQQATLNPSALHELDRREILKLFSKLLIYESMHC